MGSFHDRYISIIFDNDEDRGTDQFFEDNLSAKTKKLEIELYQKPTLVLDILHAAFTNIDKYLSKYSSFQLSNALYCMFNPSFSDYGFVFQNTDTDHEKRIETLRALKDIILYTFEDSAEPVMGHYGQETKYEKQHHLNLSCFLFWEVACIPHGCNRESIDTCLEVMGKCARSHNLAVVEGALHGLGHAHSSYGYPIIQEYIHNANFGNTPHSAALRRYAEAASKGQIL